MSTKSWLRSNLSCLLGIAILVTITPSLLSHTIRLIWSWGNLSQLATSNINYDQPMYLCLLAFSLSILPLSVYLWMKDEFMTDHSHNDTTLLSRVWLGLFRCASLTVVTLAYSWAWHI